MDKPKPTVREFREVVDAHAESLDRPLRRTNRLAVLKAMFLLFTGSRRVWGPIGIWGRAPLWFSGPGHTAKDPSDG